MEMKESCRSVGPATRGMVREMKIVKFIRLENLWLASKPVVFPVVCCSERSTSTCNERVHWQESRNRDIFLTYPGSLLPAVKEPEFFLV